jgi:hypothetical protein
MRLGKAEWSRILVRCHYSHEPPALLFPAPCRSHMKSSPNAVTQQRENQVLQTVPIASPIANAFIDFSKGLSL